MKNLGAIQDPKSVVTKEYVDGLLTSYRTSAAQDEIDAGKQAKITAAGMLKGDGHGGVSAATPGTDYVPPSDYAPDSKTAAMTQPVGRDASGKLWTKPGGGSGEQFLASLPVANWYQQTPDSSDEFWYACDITPGDFDSAEQDVQVTAANAATYEWISANAFYELAIKSTGFSLQAKAIPDFALQVFYELKTRGED